MWKLLLIVGIIVVLWAIARNIDETTPTGETTPTVDTTPAVKTAPPAIKVDASATAQGKRRELLQKLRNHGIILRIEKLDKYLHVNVGQPFYALDIDTKESFVNAIWAYYYVQDSKARRALLMDGRTGKTIGTYDERGLLLEE